LKQLKKYNNNKNRPTNLLLYPKNLRGKIRRIREGEEGEMGK
jgi:hypothetical protein